MIITTSASVANHKIVRTIGIVRGNTIRARHLGRDILAMLKMIVGGEIHDYTKMMAESREQAIDRMVNEARAGGANAVVDVRFSTSYISGAAAEILAYGTAVRMDTDEPSPGV